MTEYILKSDAIKAIQNDCLEQVYYTKEDALAAIDSIPAADVAPVAHGQWENGNPICPVCGKDKFKHLDADLWSDWKPDYCPNCGAKMDERH